MAVDWNNVNYIEYDGFKSSDYQVLVGGENTFNAPERVYDMVDIPGRNGQYALDMGRYENLEVTYTAHNAEPDDPETFRENLAELRNAYGSRIGYNRLEDTFHPDEYRMAVFKGAEVKPLENAYASDIDLVFDCKPQRWLKSGEAEIDVASGDTLTNPTMQSANPMLMVEGTGTVNIGDYAIDIREARLGTIELVHHTGANMPENSSETYNQTIDFSRCETGDIVTATSVWIRTGWTWLGAGNITGATISNESMTGFTSAQKYPTVSNNRVMLEIYPTPFSFVYGTAKTFMYSCNVIITGTTGSQTFSHTQTLSGTIYYDGATTLTLTGASTLTGYYSYFGGTISIDEIKCNSSMLINGHPMYIDCELGECYKIENNKYISLNAYVALGSDLPKLPSGDTAVTYDSTITSMKVIPRWWRL